MASKEEVNKFINTIAPYVIEMVHTRGWGVPSAIIAQAGIESAWGISKLGSISDPESCYNFFGMKWKDGCGCGYKEFKTKEQNTDGSYYTISARFRKYDSIQDGINGYAQFIEGYKRYQPLFNAKGYVEYANLLKSCGWATSIAYAQNIIKTVQSHRLEQFDGVMSEEAYIVGNTYTTNNDLYVRATPNGTKLKYDALTIDAKAKAKFDDFGMAILQKGSRVTCQEIHKGSTATWMKIPSGWICARNEEKVYIE